MSLQQVNAIGNRLSLRPPQRDSLEILARLCEIVSLEKNCNTDQALDTIKAESTKRPSTVSGRYSQTWSPCR